MAAGEWFSSDPIIWCLKSETLAPVESGSVRFEPASAVLAHRQGHGVASGTHHEQRRGRGCSRDRYRVMVDHREALAACWSDDTLVVTKLDRLATSLPGARDRRHERDSESHRAGLCPRDAPKGVPTGGFMTQVWRYPHP